MSSEQQQDEKIAALMRMFEEEKARHREAEMAAETRIRLLENKLKQVDSSSSSKKAATTPRRTTTPPTKRTTTPTTAATPRTTKTPISKTRETVTSVEPRTSDSLYATPTKRKTFTSTPLTPTSNLNRVKGSPSGSPSGVSTLGRASSATTSRSERLAAARAKRKEENGEAVAASSPSASKRTPSKTTTNNNKTPIRRTTTPTNTNKKSNNNNNGPNPEHEKSWKKFCEAAKDQFSSSELVAVSNETLQQLMDHFSVNDPIERARVEAHWAYLNEMKTGGGNNKNYQNRSSSSTTTPHRKRVKELHFPDHPTDFDLRTTVPPDPSFTPRKLLGPEGGSAATPRGCNIDAHNFTCGERKMRTLTLLRSRSPAAGGNFAESASEYNDPNSKSLKSKSKKMIDCDAKMTNNDASRVESKKFFERVPGTDTVDKNEGKRRASAIPGTKVKSEEEKHSSKRIKDVPRPRTEEENRRGIKIHVVDPSESKDAKRYVRQQQAAVSMNNVFGTSSSAAADGTLTTMTLEKLSRQKPARSLNSNNNSSAAGGPSKFQLRTPFAVDS